MRSRAGAVEVVAAPPSPATAALAARAAAAAMAASYRACPDSNLSGKR
jgi:hypothetical protein